ncbi:MAG: hypothetical protein AB1736_06700 [Chloroflexota bacterium]
MRRRILAALFAALMTLGAAGTALAGNNGYEGQPGNQSNGGGGGNSGYEGHPGNQSNG